MCKYFLPGEGPTLVKGVAKWTNVSLSGLKVSELSKGPMTPLISWARKKVRKGTSIPDQCPIVSSISFLHIKVNNILLCFIYMHAWHLSKGAIIQLRKPPTFVLRFIQSNQ